MGQFQEKDYADGLKPTKYILGGEGDGHSHVFYLRTELPIATTSTLRHAHSIEEGPNFTVICEAAGEIPHVHTKLVIEEAGDYLPRTLHI